MTTDTRCCKVLCFVYVLMYTLRISYKLIGILVQSLNGRWCCVLDYALVEPLTDKQGLRRINKICRNNIYEMRARQTHVCVSMTFMNWHRAAAVQSAVICCLLDCCCWMKVDRVYSPSVARGGILYNLLPAAKAICCCSALCGLATEFIMHFYKVSVKSPA